MPPRQPPASTGQPSADAATNGTQRALVVMIGGILAALMSIVVLLTLLLNRPVATVVVQPNPPAPRIGAGAAAAAEPTKGPSPGSLNVAAGRSPLPQPGETIVQPFPAHRLDGPDADATSPLPTSTANPPPVVPWTLAAQHAGENITAEGAVVDTYNTGTFCFLNFTRDKKGPFYIIIFQEALKGWPAPPQDYFLNKTVRVTGRVVPHNGRMQIQVRSPSQIRLIEER